MRPDNRKRTRPEPRHLTDQELDAYLGGGLNPATAVYAQRHLGECLICDRRRRVLQEERAFRVSYTESEDDVAQVRHLAKQIPRPARRQSARTGPQGRPSSMRPPPASPSRLERLRLALSTLRVPALGFTGAAAAIPGPEQQGVTGDGLLHWTLAQDEEEPGRLVFSLWSEAMWLQGQRIRVNSGDWAGELVLERLPWDGHKVGGELVISREEQASMAESERLTFKLLEGTQPLSEA